jgi:hypothetical protein
MNYEDSLSVFFYDEKRVAKFERLVEETENNKSETVRELIDDEFERRDLEIVDNIESDNTESIVEKYDPEEDFELLKDDLKQLIGEVAEINPSHIVYGEYPTGPDLVRLVEAMMRYRSEDIDRDIISQVCKDVGIESDYYLEETGRNLPDQVLKQLGVEDVDSDSRVSTKNEKEIISDAVEAILLRNGAEGRQVIITAEKVRSTYKNLDKQDRVDRLRGTRLTDEVITSALSELSNIEFFDWDNELARNAKEDWPTTPESLLEWYQEKESPDWMENDGIVDAVCTDLREFAGMADKDIAERGT